MGMSTRIEFYKKFGVIDPISFKAHKQIAESYWAIAMPVPQTTKDYFGDAWEDFEDREEIGEWVEVPCGQITGWSEISEDMLEGFEVEIDKLPADIKRIVFVNSY